MNINILNLCMFVHFWTILLSLKLGGTGGRPAQSRCPPSIKVSLTLLPPRIQHMRRQPPRTASHNCCKSHVQRLAILVGAARVKEPHATVSTSNASKTTRRCCGSAENPNRHSFPVAGESFQTESFSHWVNQPGPLQPGTSNVCNGLQHELLSISQQLLTACGVHFTSQNSQRNRNSMDDCQAHILVLHKESDDKHIPPGCGVPRLH